MRSFIPTSQAKQVELARQEQIVELLAICQIGRYRPYDKNAAEQQTADVKRDDESCNSTPKVRI